jgi:pimeloyl-ACP methyl ester carboxylesterase
VTAIATGYGHPDAGAPGANVGCRPTGEHPFPVVLVHGTVLNQNNNWQAVAPTLADAGYCVFSLTYGQTWYSGGSGGVGDVYASARQLAAFVDHVLTSTGAAKVDLVGHSQGGTVDRVYLKYAGGQTKVHNVVGMAPVNADVPGVSGLAGLLAHVPGASAVIGLGCPACKQLTDPHLFAALNNPWTYPDVRYTNIVSVHDEFITPYTIAFLPPGQQVSNQLVQSVCPDDHVGHADLVYDRDVVQMLLNALDPAHPGPVHCSRGLPL